MTFSPFGSAREANLQVRAPANQMPGRISLLPGTRQGFTGHEHLDSLGLIHMNGRVYDHRLGRFLSVDPFIQFPANSQSLNPYSYIMNNPMAGTDPSGYVIRSHRRTPLMSESCVGKEECERQQTFSGPVDDFRGSFSSGGAPSGTWNGWEAKQAIRKAHNHAKGTVRIGELVDLRKGVMLAQEGTMSDEDIRDILGEEDPRAGARRGAKSAGRIMDALGDVIEPGPEDAVGVLGKLKDGKRVGEAISQSLDELSDLRRASDAAKITKPVNLPGWRSVSIDMEHVASGHMAGGARVSSKKTLFPESMTAVQVERAVRQAYRYGQRISSQGDRVLVRGEYDGIRIDLWINTTTRTIETAYPIGR